MAGRSTATCAALFVPLAAPRVVVSSTMFTLKTFPSPGAPLVRFLSLSLYLFASSFLLFLAYSLACSAKDPFICFYFFFFLLLFLRPL